MFAIFKNGNLYALLHTKAAAFNIYENAEPGFISQRIVGDLEDLANVLKEEVIKYTNYIKKMDE